MKRETESETLPDNTEATCNVIVDEYFTGIKGELGQAERLVNDAVNNLVVNFKYINELSKEHHDMVLAIEKMIIPTDNEAALELLSRQIKTAEKIEQELELTITSLQFGDLVTQLLVHTTRQIDTLHVTLQQLDKERSCRENPGEIQNNLSTVVSTVRTESKKKPVVQQGMHMGDIELF